MLDKLALVDAAAGSVSTAGSVLAVVQLWYRSLGEVNFIVVVPVAVCP